MSSKPDSKKTDTDEQAATPHPGMMGDGTEEQNLGQPGNPAARIKKDEVDAAFAAQECKREAITSHPQALWIRLIKAGPDRARPRHTKDADESLQR